MTAPARLLLVNERYRSRLMAVGEGADEAVAVADFVDPVVARFAFAALVDNASFIEAVFEEAPF